MNKKWIALFLVFVLLLAGVYIMGVQGDDLFPANYEISKDASGRTIATVPGSSTVAFSDPASCTLINKAISMSPNGKILIKAGNYELCTEIKTGSTSIYGEGNKTVLEVGTTWVDSAIWVRNSNGITIANLAIDGNKAIRAYGATMRGINFIDSQNCVVDRVYAYDVISGQGVYMSNSHDMTVKNSQFDNIGDNQGVGDTGNYGTGIAFGEQSTTKIASHNILIQNCRISKCSMSSIDLEPANHVQVRNCYFTGMATWKNVPNPVITMYDRAGYADHCDGLEVSNCIMNGAFGEFVILTDSKDHKIINNNIQYSAGNHVAIWGSNAQNVEISGNTIATVSMPGIATENCKSVSVQDNHVTDMTASKNDYGIRTYMKNGGSSANIVITGNTVSGFDIGINTDGATSVTVSNNVVKNCNSGNTA